jgi:hypothetical protein
MIQGSEKYREVLKLLRRSKPKLDSTEDIEREVIKRVSVIPNHGPGFSEIVDFLFGWVYIGWVRRSLIAASFVLVALFIYQQSIILKRINLLSRQAVVSDGLNISIPSDRIEKLMKAYRLSGARFHSKRGSIALEEVEQLLESVNELQDRYKDLLNLIEEDPELKKIIEQRLKDSNRLKIKL